MKLAKQFKTVDFHGIKLFIPVGHVAVAVDKGGECWSYAAIPKTKGTSSDVDQEFFWTAGPVNCEQLANMDLEGMDWRDSMIAYGCVK